MSRIYHFLFLRESETLEIDDKLVEQPEWTLDLAREFLQKQNVPIIAENEAEKVICLTMCHKPDEEEETVVSAVTRTVFVVSQAEKYATKKVETIEDQGDEKEEAPQSSLIPEISAETAPS